MKKRQKQVRENVSPVQERDLSFVKGAVEDEPTDAERLKAHVDNPGQTPM
jgi:hypothetical protein